MDTKNLIGKTFGYVEIQNIIVLNKYGENRLYAICKCQCGKEGFERRLDHVIKRNKSSCGCEFSPKKEQSTNWKGAGAISGEYIASMKWRAINKLQLEFTITPQYLWALFLKQNKTCALSNEVLQFSDKSARRQGLEQTASIDRIDSNKGYVEGNVQWIHKDVNLMKNHFDQQYFIDTCKEIVKVQASQLHK
jgi:hypothetical protein